MKKLAVLLFSLLLIVTACSDPGSNNPVTSQDAQQTEKYVPVEIQEAANPAKTEGLIPVALDKINGKKGGSIPLDFAWPTFKGKVSVEANLEVPAGAFNGTRHIGYYPSIFTTVTTFFPDMEFDTYVLYSVRFENVDLSGIKSADDVKFAYISLSNDVEIIDVENIYVDVKNGVLEVVNAKLTHFSRYGFVRSVE